MTSLVARKGEVEMSGTVKFGMGSTIIQDPKTQKYTFVIHQTVGRDLGIEPMQCPAWFDTIDEAKSQGSKFLTEVINRSQTEGLSARRSSEEERKETADIFQQALDRNKER